MAWVGRSHSPEVGGRHRVRRQEAVYQGAIEEVLADGTITEDRTILFRFRRDLGLEGERASSLDERIVERLGAPAHG